MAKNYEIFNRQTRMKMKQRSHAPVNEDKEIWRQHESGWFVSNQGRFRTDLMLPCYKPTISISKTTIAYPFVSKSYTSPYKKDLKTIKCHSLVAECFLIKQKKKGYHVCHLDGDPSNWSLKNLKYVKQSENEHMKINKSTRVKSAPIPIQVKEFVLVFNGSIS